MEGGREGGHKTSAWQEESSYGFQSMVFSAFSTLAMAIAGHHCHEVGEPFTVIPIHQMREWRLWEVRQLAQGPTLNGPVHGTQLLSTAQYSGVMLVFLSPGL